MNLPCTLSEINILILIDWFELDMISTNSNKLGYSALELDMISINRSPDNI